MRQTQNPQHLMDNRILAALPAKEFERLLPHLEEVRLNMVTLSHALTRRLNMSISLSAAQFPSAR